MGYESVPLLMCAPLAASPGAALEALQIIRKGRAMGINDESDITANLQIGPTDMGMVRIFIEADGVEIPMDFEPEEAEDIAEEIKAAAVAARGVKRR